MGGVRIYHNPKCSKSRGALEILQARDVELEVVEYLASPPDRAALERILDLLPDPPAELVRRDARFRELGIDAAACSSREGVIEVLLAHPELMQRPVVIRGEQAVLARPSEKVESLFGA